MGKKNKIKKDKISTAPDYDGEGRNKSLLGKNVIFTPEVIDDIHIKAQLGRYRMRGMALMKKIPTFDDLVFLPGTLTRFVIEGYREKCETKTIIGPGCENPIELDIPVYITGMSFGALSYEAKTALARGATMAGSATCSGEGGMIPDERRYSEKWYYQCIQSRYGFNPHHAQLADAIEVFIGQGQKVGMGGHLMGQKVTDQVAEMRSLPSGIDQRSPARHPDWLGPDDLFLKVQELRELTKNKVPIQLKLGAAKVYDDVRMAAKCNPDSIFLDGMEGSTGAGPHIAAANTGIPGIAAIREARRALDDTNKTGKVTLIYAGGVRDGADMAKALALGADAIAIGTGALIALNCNKDIPEANFEKEMGVKAGQCYHCHTGRCPVGVATQDPKLRARLNPDDAALRVYNYLHSMTLESQLLARACGKTNIHSLEPEDLAALTMEASALAKVPLSGTNHTVGVDDFHKI
ncbi:FMN-binding glutamate synthase family protein [Pelagibacteraceae bacterium]|nr:FMN-binding glutamate synthase family protein [Pelagibacteraceae bacterium]